LTFTDILWLEQGLGLFIDTDRKKYQTDGAECVSYVDRLFYGVYTLFSATALRVERWTSERKVAGSIPALALLRNNLRQICHTVVCFCRQAL